MTDYLKYRGKCKEMAEALSKEKGYRLVRGFYYDAIWNKEEQHWWCEDKDGIIHDPTKDQFPTKGASSEFYREFNGYFECAECGKRVHESECIPMGNYVCCSDKCAMRLVGLA